MTWHQSLSIKEYLTMRSNLFLVLVLCFAYLQTHQASAALCSEDAFSGSPSTSCHEEYYADDDGCQARSAGDIACTRIEISVYTLQGMIDQSSDRLRNILETVEQKMMHYDRNGGIVLTYLGAVPELACSVHLRQGVFNTLGPIIYQFVREQVCSILGREILVKFFDILRNRIGKMSQPYDKLLFRNYPDDQIRSYYDVARVDPAHAVFAMLAQKEIDIGSLPEFSVGAIPVGFHDGSKFKSMREAASALGFSDEESDWQGIWSLNYDSVHDPMRIPQGTRLAVPLVAPSQDKWQGPFAVGSSADALAVEIYNNEDAIDMINRVNKIANAFGKQEMYLPLFENKMFQIKNVLFFD